MSFFAYIYQLKICFIKFFYTNKNFILKQDNTKYAQEVNANLKTNITLKCKKAAQEIQYIKNFTHWPITEAKNKIDKNAIVYLDINRYKRAKNTPKNHEDNTIVGSIDKESLKNKMVVIKRIP
jgi:hypothetical protein